MTSIETVIVVRDYLDARSEYFRPSGLICAGKSRML
jgi:hypothetical protein